MSKINPKYIKGLTKKQAEKKVKNIKKTKELLKKGQVKKAGELAKKRPTTKKGMRRSTYTIQFKKKYGEDTKPFTKKFFEKTGVPVKAQKKVFEKGEGAFLSAGSRSTVGSKEQWGYARLYAFVIKGKRGDLNFDKEIVKEYNIKFK